MADNTVPQVRVVSDATRAKFCAVFDEPVDDTDNAPDTNLACDLYVQLYQCCADMQRVQAVENINAHVVVDTEHLAVLTVNHVPTLSMVACQKLRQIGDTDAVHDIRCVFRDPKTLKPLTAGVLEVQFWRTRAPAALRQASTQMYAPPALRTPLVAEPMWDADDLRISGDEFATDRKRIVDTMTAFGNMHDAMPIGIQTTLDLVYASDNYEKSSVGKRKRTDERADAKWRNGKPAATTTTTTTDGDGETRMRGAHVGYCLLFQHPIALPPINAAFMDYLRETIGPALVNWVVAFTHTKPASKPGKVLVRREVLAVVLRRNDRTDRDVVPFSITGSEWLVRRIEKRDEKTAE